MIQPNLDQPPRLQKEENLTGNDLNQYEADIEAMNLILSPYQMTFKILWMRVRVQEISEESLTSVYTHFSQLINDLQRNNVKLPNVTINTMFLNCLQPEWYKYVTNVLLAKNVKDDSCDSLFDHLQQYEKLAIAFRAKKAAKSHDPLALVAHISSSSSRSPSPYYVTHPPSMVDYDDDYEGDTFSDDQEDSLTSAMMLLARAITQFVQADRVNIQIKNIGNGGRMARRSYKTQEASAKSGNVHKETGNIQRTLRTSSSINATNVQRYNCNAKGHYARDCPKPRVRDSKYFMEQMLLAKKDEDEVILSNEHNDFLLADAT
ncbi:gag-pol polyprotein [Tanacetum coccineum]